MATLTLALQQNGQFQGYSSIVGGTQAYVVCSDGLSGTYVILPKIASGDVGVVSFPVMLMAEGQVPSSIQVTVRAQRNNPAQTCTIRTGFAKGGVTGFDAVTDSPGVGAANFTHTFNTNPITSAAWTESDMDGLELCVSRESLTLGAARIINVAGTLTYNRAATWTHSESYIGVI